MRTSNLNWRSELGRALATLVSVTLGLASPSLALDDHPGFPGLDKDGLKDIVNEAEDIVGRPRDSTYYTVDLAPGHAFPAATRCSPEPAASPNAGKFKISLAPREMKDKYGVEGEGFGGLLEGEGRGSVIGTLVHEMIHDCMRQNGAACAYDQNGQSEAFNTACEELLVDAAAHEKLCKAITEKCVEMCDLIEAASDPPTAEEQAAIDKLAADIEMLCKEAKKIEDKHNTEEGAEQLCYCLSMSPPFPSEDPACEVEWPDPPPNDPPPDPNDPCDYPDGDPQTVIPPCDNCPCNCPAIVEEEEEDQ